MRAKKTASDLGLKQFDNRLSQENVMKALRRKDLLAFVEGSHPSYDAGWIHEDVCARLEKFSEDVEAGKNPRLMLFLPPRHGKQVADSTPVLTTDGWKNHGDLKVGDMVFHPSGVPVRVMAVADPLPQDMEVEFSDGTIVRCHENHEWAVYSRPDKKNMVVETKWFERTSSRGVKKGQPLSLESGGRYLYQIPEVSALNMTEADLAIHPYVLGVWLGDGTTVGGTITGAMDDLSVIQKKLESVGEVVSFSWDHKDTGCHHIYLKGLKQRLRKEGVLGRKHIPAKFLQGSVSQRLELLAGLVDTDGSVDARTCRVRIATVSKELADGIVELAYGLGMRPSVYVQKPCLSTSGIQGTKDVYYVSFNGTKALPTVLTRKRTGNAGPIRRRSIVAVRRSEPTIGRCIQVSAEDGLYLVERTLIPTHNSFLVSERFPVWHVGKNSNHNIIVSSYSADLAQTFSKKALDLAQSDYVRDIFPGLELDEKRQAMDNWGTTKGGGYKSVGVGGSLTGHGADILIVDDPVKDWTEAMSQRTREKVWEWWTSTAYTRLMPKSGILVVMTRWHEDDLAGRLLAQMQEEDQFGDQWEVVSYSAVAEDDEEHRTKGEALHPSRYPIEKLERIRKAVGERVWTSLYQQKPRPDTGRYMSREWFNIIPKHEVPVNLRWIRTWDLAVQAKTSNDQTASSKVAMDERGNMYIDAQIAYRLPWGSSKKRIVDLAQREGIPIGIESVAAMDIATQEVRSVLVGRCIVKSLKVNTDKLTRAVPWIDKAEMGQVFLVEGDWNDAFLDQCEEFDPMQKDQRDDRIDSVSLGYQMIKSRRKPRMFV